LAGIPRPHRTSIAPNSDLKNRVVTLDYAK
jgi:hypothetical protein